MRAFWKLTGYEWIKIWKQPVVWILLVLFTGYGVYTYSGIEVHPELTAVYEHIQGPLTQESYEIVTTTLQEIESGQREVYEEVTQLEEGEAVYQTVEIPQWGGSYNVVYLRQAADDMQALMDFEDDRVRIMEQAQKNMQKYEGSSDRQYSYRYNELVYRQAANRGELVLLEKTGLWSLTEFLGVMRPVNLYDLTALLLCMVALCSVFTKDYECGLIPVVQCSYLGRSTLFFAKMLAGGLFCIATLGILRLGIVITLAVHTDLSYLTAPIQSLSNFRSCPYNISILGMMAQQFLITVLLLLFVFLLGALVGTILKRNYIALGVQFVVTALMTALCLRSDASQYWDIMLDRPRDFTTPAVSYEQMVGEDIMKIFNPGMIMRINEYYDHYDYVDVLGFPISRLALLVSFTILMDALLLFGTWMVYTRQKSGHSAVRPRKRGRRHEESAADPV